MNQPCKKILILDKDVELMQSFKELFYGDHIFDFRKSAESLKADSSNLGDDLIDLEIITETDSNKGVFIFEEALKSKSPFGVVILDLNMNHPNKEKDFASKIRYLDPRAEIILMTGLDYTLEDLESIVGKGFSFVKKPFTSSEILQTVNKSLFEYNKTIYIESLILPSFHGVLDETQKEQIFEDISDYMQKELDVESFLVLQGGLERRDKVKAHNWNFTARETEDLVEFAEKVEFDFFVLHDKNISIWKKAGFTFINLYKKLTIKNSKDSLIMASFLEKLNHISKMEEVKVDALAKTKVKRLADFLKSFLLKYRNIQNGIQGSLSIISEENPDMPLFNDLNKLIRRSLNELGENLEDSEMLFRDIVLTTASFSLNELFGVVKGELEETCHEKSISIKIEINPNDSSFGDVSLIKKCLHHLIKNSIKALSKDSSKKDKSIILRGTKGGKQIEVIDNGPGFPKKFLDQVKLFGEKQDKSFEFGLGVPFVKEVVEAHGGKVLFSKTKSLTTVSITLP
ncbi:MAG: hypothetical protein CME68_09415 [Halobacteriovoraceae bacterium]|nr:hypothetical protein [Halobacteriovoraceae bacterium]|tara:strand:- start:487 stop:2028 length:1542 start_codon:yes stop_codon:yes gene_type:complete